MHKYRAALLFIRFILHSNTAGKPTQEHSNQQDRNATTKNKILINTNDLYPGSGFSAVQYPDHLEWRQSCTFIRWPNRSHRL